MYNSFLNIQIIFINLFKYFINMTSPVEFMQALAWIDSQYRKGRMKKEEYLKRVKDINNKSKVAEQRLTSPVANISKHKGPLEWFIDKRVKDNPISEAEKLICKYLDMYHVEYIREVSFKGLQLPTYGYPRYDFWLPAHMMCIEYDGGLYHSTEEQKAKDTLKNNFCIDNGITIKRYNKTHYYHLEQEIAKLMRKLGVAKKRNS